MENEPKTIAEKIRMNRMRLCLTRKDLGELIDVSECAIRFWESGKSKPLVRNIRNLARVFGMRPLDLIDESYGGKWVALKKAAEESEKQAQAAEKREEICICAIMRLLINMSGENRRKILEYAQQVSNGQEARTRKTTV